MKKIIGGLLDNITKAQLNSDINTIKIAEEYYKDDPLLKHFSIPCPKISSLNVELKFAYEQNNKLSMDEKTEIISCLEELLPNVPQRSDVLIKLNKFIPVFAQFDFCRLIIKVTDIMKSLDDKIDSNTIICIFDKVLKRPDRDEEHILITAQDLKGVEPEKISCLKLEIDLSDKKWVKEGNDPEFLSQD